MFIRPIITLTALAALASATTPSPYTTSSVTTPTAYTTPPSYTTPSATTPTSYTSTIPSAAACPANTVKRWFKFKQTNGKYKIGYKCLPKKYKKPIKPANKKYHHHNKAPKKAVPKTY